MATKSEYADLIDVAESCLTKTLARMRAKPLHGKELDRMKAVEAAVMHLEIARLS